MTACALMVALVYYGVAQAGLSATALPGNVTPVWPPTGLALAVLLFGGLRMWPGVALGALLVNGLSAVPLWAAVGMAAGNTFEALAGAWMFARLTQGDITLRRVRHVVYFIGTAAMSATAISATLGVLSLRASGVIDAAEVLPTWQVWWVGDMLGALVFTPLLLCWAPRAALRSPATARAVLVAAAAGAGLLLVLYGTGFEHPYMVFPALIGAALLWRLRGATAATALTCLVAVLATRAGNGRFAVGTTTHSLWLLATFLATLAVTGLVLGAVVSERDAEGVRNAALAEELRRNVVELEFTNKEVEAFAYSVSHDLRAPLRNIDGFSRNLVRRAGPQLDEEARRHLARIRANTKSMGELIDALLAFSRLQRQPLERADVDLNVVVAEALRLLESAQAGRNLTIRTAALPVVSGDRGLLVQVYVNLIGNAIKFTRTRSSATIDIGARSQSDGTFELFVADDGVGFDMAYAPRMFAVFQRLHRMEDYEGSGVGLALVERVVTRHGGRVWAEGRVGEGATLSFTLEGAQA